MWPANRFIHFFFSVRAAGFSASVMTPARTNRSVPFIGQTVGQFLYIVKVIKEEEEEEV